MTPKPYRAFLFVLLILAVSSLACITVEQEEWLDAANESQREGLATSTAEVARVAASCSGDRLGWACSMIAPAPATRGQAMLEPE